MYFPVVLGIYRIAFSHKKLGISRDVLTTKTLPHLLQLSMECNLNIPQYSAFADLIREMITQIETEQRAKLTEMHAMDEDTSTLVSIKIFDSVYYKKAKDVSLVGLVIC